MTEKFLGAESIPTPEKNIKKRLIEAAQEVAQLGSSALGMPVGSPMFATAFHEVGKSYQVAFYKDHVEDGKFLIIHFSERGEKGLYRRSRIEFHADGSVRRYVRQETEQDIADFIDFLNVAEKSGDNFEKVDRTARAINAQRSQRDDQSEAVQRDMGFTEVADETELVDVLRAFEERLAVLKKREKGREK